MPTTPTKTSHSVRRIGDAGEGESMWPMTRRHFTMHVHIPLISYHKTCDITDTAQFLPAWRAEQCASEKVQ